MRRPLVAALLALSLLAGPAARAADYGPNLEPRAVTKVQPAYPALARRHGVQGVVVVGLEVAADGTVTRATFLEGNSLFRSASIEAAKRWAFRPSSAPAGGHIVFRFSTQGG